MSDETKIKEEIKQWMIKKNGNLSESEIDFETKILEKKLISSLQVMDLIVFLGKINNGPINMSNLKPGSFSDINTIYSSFLK